MAADRMARGRRRARQVLAGHRPAGHAVRSRGRSGQTTLADRTRLPGAETGTGPWTLRGARLARLPSSRHAVHRGLCLPDRRAGENSPSAADKFAASVVPQNRPPRGAARPPRTTCHELDRDNAPTPDRRHRNHPGAMSLLQRTRLVPRLMLRPPYSGSTKRMAATNPDTTANQAL